MVAALMVGIGRLPPPAAVLPDMVAQMKEALRRAVLTLAAVPDPDKRYLRIVSPQISVLRDAAEAYGWTPEIVSFHPTPRDVQVYLDVLKWLTWYERERRDPEVIKLFIAWSSGAEWWQLSSKFAASERTLRRWIDNMCCVILYQFEDAFKKIFLDECHECQPKRDSSLYEADLASDDIPAEQKRSSTWHAVGALPLTDTSIPEIAEARSRLVRRLEKQNRDRLKGKRRKRKKRRNTA